VVEPEHGVSAAGRQFNDAVTRFWSAAAPLYDLAVLQRLVYRPAQDEVLSALRNHEALSILLAQGAGQVADIACGTGVLADRIQTELHPDEVYGVDMADGMLEQARARSSAVRWRKAPAEQLPFADGSLDAVVSTTAFHFFDQPAAMREFHRVLAPGGIAAVATISPPLPAPLRRLSANPANPAHNPSPAEMRTLFADAGFTLTRQNRVNRPLWTRGVWDLITVGTKP
jgi:ubiquinone/menaquinone biosynthesis C-methylase UbiE